MDVINNKDGSSVVVHDDLCWVRARSDSKGIVAAIAWMLCKPTNFTKYSHLYASCNWDSLVCHPRIFELWFPARAHKLASRVLDQLLQEIQQRPRPIVFATFSGGCKACLYKLFRILDDGEGESSEWAKYRAIRRWYAGVIHDSSPVDFVSRNGAHFMSHPVTLGTKSRNGLLTWSAYAAARTLDFFFLPNFEKQRAEMWNMLNKSGEWGPVLIFCSRDDDLAPITDIETFGSNLSYRGCKVTMMVWAQSPHVGHLRKHYDEYRQAMITFLVEAASAFESKLDWNSSGHVAGVSSSMCSAVEWKDMVSIRKLIQPLTATAEQSREHTTAEGKKNFWGLSRM